MAKKKPVTPKSPSKPKPKPKVTARTLYSAVRSDSQHYAFAERAQKSKRFSTAILVWQKSDEDLMFEYYPEGVAYLVLVKRDGKLEVESLAGTPPPECDPEIIPGCRG